MIAAMFIFLLIGLLEAETQAAGRVQIGLLEAETQIPHASEIHLSLAVAIRCAVDRRRATINASHF